MKTLKSTLFNQDFYDNWDRYFRQLQAYSKQNGGRTLAIPPDADQELVRWVGIQRGLKVILPASLKNKLTSLNFPFEEQGFSWEHRYQQLADFFARHGHACLPAGDPEYEDLQEWLLRQIKDQQFLAKSQFQKLEALGVNWDLAASRDQRWERMFLKLKAFREANGHCRVPQGWPQDKQLATWVCLQRRMCASNKLRTDRHRRLEELDFIWHIQTIHEAQWEKRFQELQLFRQAHGHCKVPGSNKALTSWMENQRTSKRQNLLPPCREKRLNEIHFIWSFQAVKENSWEEHYRQLQAYKQKHGNCLVPLNNKDHSPLGQWVGAQRRLEAKNKLSRAKKNKLSQLGFVWSRDIPAQVQGMYEAQWQVQFGKLVAYRQRHGSCQVSLKIDPQLQRWTRWQRILFQQGRLSLQRRQCLDAIGFPWCIREGYWQKMYQALAHFFDQFGHSRVPAGWPPNPRLAAWVYHTKKNKTSLSPGQIRLLDKLNFNWALHAKTVLPWQEMYDRLVAYKQEHGHTRIPTRWPQDPKLAKWASRMRYEREKLLPAQVALLQAIAFDWGKRRNLPTL